MSSRFTAINSDLTSHSVIKFVHVNCIMQFPCFKHFSSICRVNQRLKYWQIFHHDVQSVTYAIVISWPGCWGNSSAVVNVACCIWRFLLLQWTYRLLYLFVCSACTNLHLKWPTIFYFTISLLIVYWSSRLWPIIGRRTPMSVWV